MKPGLYVATVRGEKGVIVTRQKVNGKEVWASMTYPDGHSVHGDRHVTDLHPLVVLDPEKREDAETLLSSWLAHDSDAPTVYGVDAMQATLRALAAPTPAEPMGLGAVAKDAHGYIWLRQDYGITPGALPWWSKSLRGQREWSEIESPEVLSEGWSA